MAFRAPLLGYNTNVRHKGKLYHIQTEDSGIDHPHVITHLFADGGRIVASKKTSYAERVGSDGLPDQVKKLMQGQHKAMFISLRDGIYDEDASSSDDAAEPTPLPGVSELASSRQAASSASRGSHPEVPPASSIELDGARAVEAAAPLSAETALPAIGSVEDTDDEQIVTTPPRQGEGAVQATARTPLYQPAQGPGRLSEANGHDAPYQARAEEPRAATSAISADVGRVSPGAAKSSGARSLFGGDLLSDKSLDEVILNYLAANEKDA
jgi:hypothetical protein